MKSVTNFAGLNGFVWWVGVVENRNDPLKLGRCQIRIFGWHTDNLQLIPSKDLPWALPILPINDSKSFTTPVEGDYCVGFFMDGESGQFPIYFGVLPSIPLVAASQDPNAPQMGFKDLRTTTQLTNSPALPASVTASTDGSGASVTPQPAKRNPEIAGFPDISKLAINDTNNPPAQITQRLEDVVKDIPGPTNTNLATAIAGAAAGAQEALTGIVPNLKSLVPDVSSLSNALAGITPSLNSALSSASSALSNALTGITPSLNSALSSASSALSNALTGITPSLNSALSSASSALSSLTNVKIPTPSSSAIAKAQAAIQSQLAEAQASAASALANTQFAASASLDSLKSNASSIADKISSKLSSLSSGSIKTTYPVVMNANNVPIISSAGLSIPLNEVNTMAETLKTQLSSLETQLKKLLGSPGAQGPTGSQGPIGSQGSQGGL